jgi:hypothetical protein
MFIDGVDTNSNDKVEAPSYHIGYSRNDLSKRFHRSVSYSVLLYRHSLNVCLVVQQCYAGKFIAVEPWQRFV